MNVQPSVAEYDGTYNYDARKHTLTWNIPVIDAANRSGSMEFSCSSSIPGDFFPVQVSFHQIKSLIFSYFYFNLKGIICVKNTICCVETE